MGQCASEDLYTSFTPCINNRPLQGKENFHNSSGVKKSNHYGSPSADEVLRPSKKSRSKYSDFNKLIIVSQIEKYNKYKNWGNMRLPKNNYLITINEQFITSVKK